jgi:hypothetical protein
VAAWPRRRGPSPRPRRWLCFCLGGGRCGGDCCASDSTRSSLDAALAAIAADPLRESAHRSAIEVHLAEGNVGEALKQFSVLFDVLARELGIAPSRQTRDLLTLYTGRRAVGWQASISSCVMHRASGDARRPA